MTLDKLPASEFENLMAEAGYEKRFQVKGKQVESKFGGRIKPIAL